jgi:hypothetical protein
MRVHTGDVRCTGRPRWAPVDVRWPVVALMGSLALASCTSDPNEPADDTPAPLRPALSIPPDHTSVIPHAEPVELSVAASEALYEHAPVVLLADAEDVDAQARAAAVAVDLSAPLLLAPAGGTAAREAPAQPRNSEPSEVAAAGTAGLERELRRLAPEALLTFGTAIGEWADERVPDAAVVPAHNPGPDAELPDVQPPDPLDSLLVLASDGDQNVAALATAQASGARVLVLDDPDPRADPDVIAELAGQPPERVLAFGREFGSAEQLRARLDVAETGVELPGGGQVLFPGRRFVALYGHPHTPAMGALGQQSLPETIERAQRHAAEYEPLVSESVIPTLEIIATVASTAPGADGNYSAVSTVEDLRPWVEAAADAGAYVVLDLQPGRSDFLTQAQHYEQLLLEPHVGLALDPEWRLAPDERHLEQIGSVSAAEINSVIGWLADLTREHNLPQKILVLHQFRTAMITDREDVDTSTDEVAVLIHADGFGTPSQKFDTWDILHVDPPPDVWWGWKNFLDEDNPTFTPAETVAIDPSPLFVSYQ